MAGISVIDAHQQQRLVAVTVKTEPRARWSAVLYHPETGNAVACVERVCRIDEEEPTFLLIPLLGEEGSCRVHRALYPSF